MAQVHGRLVVAKKDEVYLSISTEDSIRKELSEFFKFKVPGAEFIPAVRRRFWDGYIRLFNLNTNQIYLGLYDYLKEFCDEITLDFEMQMTMADDDLAWVTDDVKMFAYETIMEELKDVLVDYFDLIL